MSAIDGLHATQSRPSDSRTRLPGADVRNTEARLLAYFDRSNFRGASIDGDHRQFALHLGWQAAQLFHDGLPFLDLADRPSIRRSALL